MNLSEIISKIKTKKWKNLDENVILEKIDLFLKRNPKTDIEKLTEKEIRPIIKFVRQELHRSYGAFQSDVYKRNRLLNELKKETPNNERNKEQEINEIKLKILKTHSSTRERLDLYDEIKKDLANLIKNKIILDLGCGLNPLMFDENKIIAAEFNKDDVDFLNEYFSFANKKSKAILLDLTKVENIEKLKEYKVDVIFAWKLFDLLNSNIIEAIMNLDAVKIVSFSTKTLGNRKMNSPKRKWFENRLNAMNLDYETARFESEIFYIIK
ncbi:hypothetical protein JXB27_02770 [Candidatus Woesearchaeota archaeon]|nr:hypothetical protein [Candidatus Woesearchaeota archaeon]